VTLDSTYDLRRILRELVETRDRLQKHIDYLASIIEPEWSPGEKEMLQENLTRAGIEHEEQLELEIWKDDNVLRESMDEPIK